MVTYPFHVIIRQHRRVMHELIVDAPNIKAVRPVLRSYMVSKQLEGRASWHRHAAPEAIPAGLERIDWQWHPPIVATLDGWPVLTAWPREARRRIKDSQRRRVYDADLAMWPSSAPADGRALRGNFNDQRSFLTTSEVQRYVNEVTATAGAKPIKVVTTRAKSRGKARYSDRTINMPSWTWFEHYVLHEVAHHFTADKLGEGYRWHTEYEAHGPEFATTLHQLIKRHMGDDAATRYLTACRRHGVRHFIDATPMPEPTPRHDFPLAAGTPSKALTRTEQGYVDSYRRYRQGARNSAPSLRKNMTKERALELRAIVDNEVPS